MLRLPQVLWQRETEASLNYSQCSQMYISRRGPVTSVEWCPFESSVLTTTSGDGQLVVWDLALERDPEEEAALVASMNAASPDELPAQLLFVHLGQVCLPPPVWFPHSYVCMCTYPLPTWLHQDEVTPERTRFSGSGIMHAVMHCEAHTGRDQSSIARTVTAVSCALQSDIKEAHWHPQIPGMIISTALSGFNIFKPANVGSA